MRKAVFFDKDGTLVKDVPYNVDVERLALYPEAGDALRRLADAGFTLAVVSNQPGIAHGYFEEKSLGAVEKALNERLQASQATIEGFFYCPHHPQGRRKEYSIDCNCRKPRPGLILSAARNLDVDTSVSWMVGDILNDVEAGKRAGCRTILVNRGNETEWKRGRFRDPDYIADNLLEAAAHILAATMLEDVREIMP